MLGLLAKYKVAAIVIALVGTLSVAGGGVALAAANGALPLASVASAVTPAKKTPGASMRGHAAAWRVVHGTVVVYVKGADVTYTLDAGQVVSATSSAITLKRADGQQVTLTLSAQTTWGAQGKGQPKNLAKLVGREGVIFSQNGVATQVGGKDALLKSAVHADLTIYTASGQTRALTLDRGAVQSVSLTQISLKRADGVVITEPVSPKAKWTQEPGHSIVQPGNVAPGASVMITTTRGKVMRVVVVAN